MVLLAIFVPSTIRHVSPSLRLVQGALSAARRSVEIPGKIREKWWINCGSIIVAIILVLVLLGCAVDVYS